ncbi:MAG: hypothetical protein HYV17_11765 [Xanthomonadales bacterium]|nr:hypothetical protein [Xanthomonadales bacterium]
MFASRIGTRSESESAGGGCGGGWRAVGIGVQFNETADGETAKSKIEAILGATLSAERPTHTM